MRGWRGRRRWPGRRCRRPAVTGGVALLAAAVAGCTGGSAPDAGASPATTGVVISSDSDAGSSGVRLPPAAHVDDAANGTYDISMTVRVEGEDSAASGPQRAHVQMSYRTSVVDVDEDGSYTTQTAVDDLHVVSASKAVEEIRSEFAALSAFTLRQDYGSQGAPHGPPEIVDEAQLEPDQRDLVHQFVDGIAHTAVVYADEPVAEGDTWQARRTFHENGVDLTVVTHYTLTKLSDESYTITYDRDNDIDQTRDSDGGPTAVTGHVSGTGTIVGSRANPVAVTVRSEEKLQMSFSRDSGEMQMSMRFRYSSHLR